MLLAILTLRVHKVELFFPLIRLLIVLFILLARMLEDDKQCAIFCLSLNSDTQE